MEPPLSRRFHCIDCGSDADFFSVSWSGGEDFISGGRVVDSFAAIRAFVAFYGGNPHSAISGLLRKSSADFVNPVAGADWTGFQQFHSQSEVIISRRVVAMCRTFRISYFLSPERTERTAHVPRRKPTDGYPWAS